MDIKENGLSSLLSSFIFYIHIFSTFFCSVLFSMTMFSCYVICIIQCLNEEKKMDWLAGWLVVITEYPSIHIRMFMVFFYSLVICLFACLVILFKNEMKNSLKKIHFFSMKMMTMMIMSNVFCLMKYR